MTSPDIILFMQHAIWLCIKLLFVPLTASLVIGFVVGLFQALTSIQEMTLTFVPKIFAILILLWLSMGYILDQIKFFFQGEIYAMILQI